MINNARIGDLIRENKPESITDAVAEGEFHLMQTFQKALIDKVLEGVVEREVAANASSNKHDFMVALEYAEKAKGAGIDPNSPASVQVAAQAEPEPEPVAVAAPPALQIAEPAPEFSLRLAPLGE
jgi:hypothetical protein